MKIFLTGKKQIGKSTCIKKFVNTHNILCCGYTTIPYYEGTKKIGYALHSLVDINVQDRPFSIRKTPIPNVFDDMGVKILNASKNGLLILDEIGFLERNESYYIHTLLAKIKSYPNILGVLRKESIDYIEKIKKMEDVLLLDLDCISQEKAMSILDTIYLKESV